MGFHENLIQSFRNFKERFIGDIGTGTVAQLVSSLRTDVNNLLNNKADKSAAISNITRSGTTFTATRANGTTFTFTQQDNNTTTGTTYNAGSCPDNTTFGTNGSIRRAYNGAISAVNENAVRYEQLSLTFYGSENNASYCDYNFGRNVVVLFANFIAGDGAKGMNFYRVSGYSGWRFASPYVDQGSTKAIDVAYVIKH